MIGAPLPGEPTLPAMQCGMATQSQRYPAGVQLERAVGIPRQRRTHMRWASDG